MNGVSLEEQIARRRACIEALRGTPGQWTGQVARKVGLDRKTTGTLLVKMEAKGLVAHEQHHNSPYYFWRLTPAGTDYVDPIPYQRKD